MSALAALLCRLHSFAVFSFLLLVAVLAGPPGAGAQVRFAPARVGTDAPAQTVAVTLSVAGTVDSLRITAEGSAGFDFTGASGPADSCAPGASYAAGQSCTLSVVFHPVVPGLRRGAVTLLDRAGQTLGAAYVAGIGIGPLATFVPGTINTIAGDQAWIYGGDGNQATQSSIFLPFGLAVDAAGDIYIADSANNRVRRVDALTGTMSTVAGNGVIGSNGDGGPAVAASLSNPTSIALDAAGNVFFSDSGNNVVRRIDAGTGMLTTVAGTLRMHAYTGDGGPATAATLNTPNGIAFDAAGNLYIADTGNHAVRMVAAATGQIVTLAGRGVPGFAGDGGPASAALLASPWSVTPGPGGELYIADQNNNRIRMISAAGILSTVAGAGPAGYKGDEGPALEAQLNVPASVALDVAGNLYVADSGNNRVRKINAKTGIITSVAGNLGESFSGDDGPADAAGLYGPYTLALDGQGSLFIADVFHNRIRKVSANAATLNFPAIRVGRVAAPETQRIENDGNANLVTGTVTVVKDAQVDATGTNCTQGAIVQPLENCVIAGAFAPTTTGTRVKGALSAGSDAANSPGILTLVGQVLDIDPSTVALTSAPNPSMTGSTVTFSVSVTSAGATPTGMVTLMDGVTAVTRANLAGGGITFPVHSLSSGQHIMTAVYAGDASTASSTSGPLLQVVKDQQAATTTTIASDASPAVAGATLHLTATVSATVAGAGNGNIGGSVTFMEGSTVLGTASIANGSANSGAATLPIATLGVGSHTVTAAYQGSATYAASTSAGFAQAVRIATTQTALATDANPSHSGGAIVITATVSSNGGIPGGQVTFSDGTATLGKASLNAQGKATLAIAGAAMTVGTHTLSASYDGDAADQPSTAAPFSQVVDLANTTTSLVTSLNPTAFGAPVTLTASVAGNGGIPAGTVQFLDGAKVLGAAVLDSAGIAGFAVSTLAVGTHTITASYLGDALDGSSSSLPLDQIVQAATAGVTLSPSAAPAIAGTPVSFVMQVNATGARPSGLVTLLDGTTPLGTASLDATGAATLTLSTLAIGQHPLTASYAGDTYHPAALSATVIETIQQATVVSMLSSASRIVAGTPVTFSIAVAGSGGQPTPGRILLNEGAQVLATLTPDAKGQASYTISALAVGQHTLVASYAGDTLSAASSSSSLLQTIDIATTATSLSAGINPVFSGSPVTFTASVTGSGATPTGTLTFRDGSNVIGAGVLNAKATATLTLSTLAPGNHTVTATYEGDANDQASVSPALTEQVVQKTTVSLAASANPTLLTDSVTLSIAVSNGVPGSVPTGPVTLTDGGGVLAVLPLDASGYAVYTLTQPALGTHLLVASYPGDAQNTPADSPSLSEVVTLRPTTLSLTSSTIALSAGQQLILISVLKGAVPQGAAPRLPGGLVTFASGATVLGTATVDAAGVATLTATPAQAGLNVVAKYAGDALYAASTSPSVAIVVGPPVEFNLTLTPPGMTLVSGQHGSLGITVASAGTFSDTLVFGCAGLPASATCTFSANRVQVAGGVAKSLTVTVDTGNPLGAGPRAQAEPPGPFSPAEAPLAAMLPLGAGVALVLGRRRLRGARLLAALLTLASLTMALSGCGSSFAVQATPAGSYSFQIVASGAATTATQTATVQLTVTR